MAKKGVKVAPVSAPVPVEVPEEQKPKKPPVTTSAADVISDIEDRLVVSLRLWLRQAIELTADKKMKTAVIACLDYDPNTNGIDIDYDTIEVDDAAEFYQDQLRAMSSDYKALN